MTTILKSPLACGVLGLFYVSTVTARLYLINKCKHIAILVHSITFLKLPFNLCNRLRIVNTYCLDPSIVF